MRKYLFSTLLLLATLEAKAYNAGDVVFQTVSGTNKNSYYYGLRVLNKNTGNLTYIWTPSSLGPDGESAVIKATDIKQLGPSSMDNLGVEKVIYGTSNPKDKNTPPVNFKATSSLEYDKHKDYYFSVRCTPIVQIEHSQCTIFKHPVD